LPLAVSAPVDWLPEVALAPDQPPEAVQEVALVEDQVSVEDPPLATDAGFAASDTVGTGGGEGSTAELSTLSPPQPANARASTGTSSRAMMRSIGNLINGLGQRYPMA
jgi:hypothetical protein